MAVQRICIVGAGNLSTKRIYPLVGQAGAQIAGVCDLDAEKAKKNATLWGGNVYSDMGKMLDAEKPDGVIICISADMHAKLAPLALKKGIPVYTEKPPAETAATALEVAKIAKQTGVLCTNAFKKRYNVAYSRAKEWLSKFPESDLYSISIDYASRQYENNSLRRLFLFDFTIHIIDLTQYLFGDASKVFAFSKGPDAYAVSIQFASGAVGSLNLTDGRSFNVPTEEVELTVKGGNFMTIHNSSVYRITENERPVEWREPPTFTSAGDSGNDTGHLAELADFLAAIREKRTTRSNIYESYKSMVLYEAIKNSAETGKVSEIKYEKI
ncbi:MAG: Gfo/Idh/MocA family oxidoreductase [Victivallales bacterium]